MNHQNFRQQIVEQMVESAMAVVRSTLMVAGPFFALWLSQVSFLPNETMPGLPEVVKSSKFEENATSIRLPSERGVTWGEPALLTEEAQQATELVPSGDATAYLKRTATEDRMHENAVAMGGSASQDIASSANYVPEQNVGFTLAQDSRTTSAAISHTDSAEPQISMPEARLTIPSESHVASSSDNGFVPWHVPNNANEQFPASVAETKSEFSSADERTDQPSIFRPASSTKVVGEEPPTEAASSNIGYRANRPVNYLQPVVPCVVEEPMELKTAPKPAPINNLNAAAARPKPLLAPLGNIEAPGNSITTKQTKIGIESRLPLNNAAVNDDPPPVPTPGAQRAVPASREMVRGVKVNPRRSGQRE